MKRYFSMIMVLTLLIATLLPACSMKKASPIEDFTYELIDGEAVITGYIGNDLDIVIPDMIDKRPVTTIGEEAFMHYDMDSIVLPNTLITIERDAFRACRLLKEITIPDGVIEVKGEYTFADCESLETIHLPNSVQRFDCQLRSTPWYESQPDGVLYIDKVCFGFKGKDYPDSLEIKEGTRSIIRLFSGYIDNHGMTFTDIYIPESVGYIAPKSIAYYMIRGKSESYAEVYAKENHFLFANTDYVDKDITGNYILVDVIINNNSKLDEVIARNGDITLTINGSNAVERATTGEIENMTVDIHRQIIMRSSTDLVDSYTIQNGKLVIQEGLVQWVFEKQ